MRYTEAFLLKRYKEGIAQGTRVSEIADSLRLSPSTFSARICRAKGKIRNVHGRANEELKRYKGKKHVIRKKEIT